MKIGIIVGLIIILIVIVVDFCNDRHVDIIEHVFDRYLLLPILTLMQVMFLFIKTTTENPSSSP